MPPEPKSSVALLVGAGAVVVVVVTGVVVTGVVVTGVVVTDVLVAFEQGFQDVTTQPDVELEVFVLVGAEVVVVVVLVVLPVTATTQISPEAPAFLHAVASLINSLYSAAAELTLANIRNAEPIQTAVDLIIPFIDIDSIEKPPC